MQTRFFLSHQMGTMITSGLRWKYMRSLRPFSGSSREGLRMRWSQGHVSIDGADESPKGFLGMKF
jgi:hypothetical protein